MEREAMKTEKTNERSGIDEAKSGRDGNDEGING